MRLLRFTRGEAHIGVYCGPWYLGMAGSPWLWFRPHLWHAFIWWGSPPNSPILRVGPLTVTWWKGKHAR
jgi:hypothetical protein